MGIRKTLGASTRDILALLVRQFLRPVLLANLIAWPLAWLAMRGWLAGFDQRISLSPGYFLAATLLTWGSPASDRSIEGLRPLPPPAAAPLDTT